MSSGSSKLVAEVDSSMPVEKVCTFVFEDRDVAVAVEGRSPEAELTARREPRPPGPAVEGRTVLREPDLVFSGDGGSLCTASNEARASS